MNMTVAAIAIRLLGEPQIDPQQHECLALNIYHEARGESEEGQIAVAHVTLNRADHSYFPDSVCDVVWQKKQFSWTFVIRNQEPQNEDAWETAQKIAYEVMSGKIEDISNGATFYHSKVVNPSWNSQMEVSTVIGKHVFYVWDGTWS